MTIPTEKFGKDHWSTFAYLETLAVDNKGRPDNHRMRCDLDRHPAMDHAYSGIGGQKYPTILAGGDELPDHDDWDCIDDLEAAGFVEQGGTGIHPVFKLTETGYRVAAALRKHKAEGGNFASFRIRWPLPLA